MIVQIPNSFQGLHQFIFYNHPQFVQQNYKMFKLIPEHILKKHIVSNIDSVTFVLNFKTYYGTMCPTKPLETKSNKTSSNCSMTLESIYSFLQYTCPQLANNNSIKINF